LQSLRLRMRPVLSTRQWLKKWLKKSLKRKRNAMNSRKKSEAWRKYLGFKKVTVRTLNSTTRSWPKILLSKRLLWLKSNNRKQTTKNCFWILRMRIKSIEIKFNYSISKSRILLNKLSNSQRVLKKNQN
jgi:hypothetical protein